MKFWHQQGVAVCLALSAGMVWAQSDGQAQFAALAIEGQKKTAYGFAYDQASREDAEAKAIAQCKKHAGNRSCEVVLAWSGPMCGAYYSHKKGLVHGWGIANTRASAESRAMYEFYARGPFEFADVHAYACNSGTQGARKVLVNKPNTEPPAPQILQNNGGYITGLALSRDGKTAYSADRAGNIRAWDVTNGRQIRTFSSTPVPSAKLGLSQDGKRLVATADGQIRVWETATGRTVVDTKFPRSVDYLVFSRDGSALYGIAAADHSVSPAWPSFVTWDANSGRVRSEVQFKLPSSFIYGMFMASNESQFITVSDNPNLGVNLWDRATGNKVKVLGDVAARSAALVDDGKTLMYVPTKGNVIYSTSFPSGDEARTLRVNGTPYSVTTDASGKQAYMVEVKNVIWKLSGEGKVSFRVDNIAGKRLTHVAVARNGKIIATGSDDGSLRFWHADSGAPLPASTKK